MENNISAKKMKTADKIVNDVVHGIIKLPTYILNIIDTHQFQRLRWISQMGFVQFVYPSATGNRFEHSIGTFHLASTLLKQIQKQIEEENIVEFKLTDEDIRCVKIAALCHDLGHGPFSHTWDEIIPFLKTENEKTSDKNAYDNNRNKEKTTKKNKTNGSKADENKECKSHEERSGEIVEDILMNTNAINHSSLQTMKMKDIIGLKEDHIDIIKRIILGKYDPEKDNEKKKFLFQIVANKDSGLDVDKFDYLCRDFSNVDSANKNQIHDIRRIMHFMRVIKNNKGEWCLAVKDREIFHIHNIFYSRHLLHRYACQHKTVKAFECMFREAMKTIIGNENHLRELIDNVLGVKPDKTDTAEYYNKSKLNSKEFISKCCDHHIWNMMNKHTSDIVKRINERNLYSFFCQMKCKTRKDRTNNSKTRSSKENAEEEESLKTSDIKSIRESCVEALEKSLNHWLEEKCIINTVKLTLSKFSLTSEDEGSPFFKIPFYSRDNMKEIFYYDEKNRKPPELTNLICQETIISIYTEHVLVKQSDKRDLDKVIQNLCENVPHDSLKGVIADIKQKWELSRLNGFD